MLPRALFRQPKFVALLLGCAVMFLTVAVASADSLQPVTAGPIVVADGVVTATGSGNDSLQNATVTVNGQPASVDGNGTITSNVDLTGQSTLTFAATQPDGTTTTTSVPVSLIGPGGIVPASAFDQLKNAGVTVNVPPGGFVGTSGTPTQVSGGVADKGELAGLTVNGTDALSSLKPDGSYAVSVPGTDRSVVVAATSKNGVSESSSHAAATSVAAGAAKGVRFAKVGYSTKGVKAHKRIRVTFTIKDKRGLLIQGAKVRIRAARIQHRLVVRTPAAKRTSRAGKVTFTLHLRAAKFSRHRRLHTVATASTPSAKTTRATSIRVPRLTRSH
jgi:hypothetical protein